MVVSGGVVSGGVTGQLFLRSRLGCVPSPLNLMDFTDVMMAAMFVAAGCDYCKSLRGIGVVTASVAITLAMTSARALRRIQRQGAAVGARSSLTQVDQQLELRR